MNIIIKIFVIFKICFLTLVEPHTVCDCEHAKTKAVIDLSVPDYCHKEDHYTHEKPKKVHYNIWSKAKPPYMFKGFMCEMYIKEKTVKGNFWVGSYDTTFRQYTRSVSLDDCRQLINNKLCGKNRAEESAGTFKFEAEPEGSGSWMAKNVYSTTNCIGHSITLRQEDPHGPILSPIGILAGASHSDGYYYFNQKMIFWEKSVRMYDEYLSCQPVHLLDGEGVQTYTKRQGRMVDAKKQLEVLFNSTLNTICTLKNGTEIKAHQVYGLPGGYVTFDSPIVHHSKKTKRKIRSTNVIFDDSFPLISEENPIDVAKFVWDERVQREYQEYLQEIDEYRDAVFYGNIYLIENPNVVVTSTKTLHPMNLNKRREVDEAYNSQQFKLEAMKLWEIDNLGDAPSACVSVREPGKPWDAVVWIQGCDYDAPETRYNMNYTRTTRWAYDPIDGLLIETETSRCLTYMEETQLLSVKPCNDSNNNQKWKFENVKYNSKYDHFRNATGLVLNYDDEPHIEETIESIKEKNRLFIVDKNSFAYGRLKMYKDSIGCVTIRSHKVDKVIKIQPCIEPQFVDYYEAHKLLFQDLEHVSDYTIRKTGTNLCLDVLLPAKRASRKYLFPAVHESPHTDNKTFSKLENIREQMRNQLERFEKNDYKENNIIIHECQPGSTRWIYDDVKKQMIHFELRDEIVGCLTKTDTLVKSSKCDDNDHNQKWEFDYENKDKFQILTGEQVKDPKFFESFNKLPEPEQDKIKFPFMLRKKYKDIDSSNKEPETITELTISGMKIMSQQSNDVPSSSTSPTTTTTTTTTTTNMTIKPNNPPPIAVNKHNNNKDQSSDSNLSGSGMARIKLKNILTDEHGSQTGEIDIAHLTDFVKEKIIPFHSQYENDRHVDNENEIQNSLRQIYCEVAIAKRQNLMTIANLSPILAAISVGLTNCHRVEGHGYSLLLQECKAITKEILSFESRCNRQPYFTHAGHNYTLGSDGWSMIKITTDQENWCFWRNSFININSKTYFWSHLPNNANNGSWVEQMPTIHGTNLNLVKRFTVLPVNDYDYRLHGHDYHDKIETEQLNILMELSGRAMQYDSDHIGSIVTNEKQEAYKFDIFNWVGYIRIILFVCIGIAVFGLLIKFLMVCNPLPLIDRAIDDTKLKFRSNKKAIKQKEKELKEIPDREINTPSSPPIYASLTNTTILNDTITQLDDSNNKRHSHIKCNYVKGTGLIWNDGCLCGNEKH